MTTPDAHTHVAPIAYSAAQPPPIVDYPADTDHAPWALAAALGIACVLLAGVTLATAVTYHRSLQTRSTINSITTMTLPAPPPVTVHVAAPPPAAVPIPPPVDPDTEFFTALGKLGWGIENRATATRVAADQCAFLEEHPGASVGDIAAHLRTTFDGDGFTPDQAPIFVVTALQAYCPKLAAHVKSSAIVNP